MIKNCSNCERRFKEESRAGCQAFKEKPVNCWAWTDDPAWEVKIALKVNRYSGDKIYKNIDRMIKTRPVLKSLLKEI